MTETPRATRAEIRARMDAEFAALEDVLDAIDDADMTGPTDDAGWTVLDHVVHMCCWAEGIAALLQRQPRWERMGIPEFDPTLRPAGAGVDFDDINEVLRQRNQGLTPADARQRLRTAHDAVAAAVDALGDDGVNLPYGRFVEPFTDDVGDPIFGRVLGNTAGHYEEHTPWILAILGR